jgi:hypothetical protein
MSVCVLADDSSDSQLHNISPFYKRHSVSGLRLHHPSRKQRIHLPFRAVAVMVDRSLLLFLR